METDSLKAYDVLGVEPGASGERIRKAYVDLIQTWDPEAHVNNPILRAEAEKHRNEVEEAYRIIRSFHPELLNMHDPQPEAQRQTRDFRELSVAPKVEFSKAVLGVISALALAGVIGAAYYLYKAGRSVTPPVEQVAPLVKE